MIGALWGMLVKKLAISRASFYGPLIGFAIGGWCSWYVMDMIADAKKAALVPQIIHVVTEYQEIEKEVIKTQVETVREIEYVDRIVEKEVTKYVPVEDSACNIPIGSVRLLNASRRPGTSESVLPTAASESDDSAYAPSTIGRADLIQSDREIATMYNKLAAQTNGLIDFIERQQKLVKGEK